MTAGGCLILGVGNLLLRDEGIGIHVVRELARGAEAPGGDLPPGTRVVDGGTLGLDLLSMLDDVDAVVFVDAANLARPPGTVAVLRDAEVAAATGGQRSTDRVGLAELLHAARLAGTLPPRVALVAIQPAEVAPGLDLTPEVAAALPVAVAATRAEAWTLAAPHG